MISGSAEHEGLKRENFNQESACIIGAGVAGLLSAKALKRDGFDVTVFEKGVIDWWCLGRTPSVPQTSFQ